MPEKKTIERARRDARRGKAPSTQAGEFVREEIHHVREGKHGARSTRQAIAIGLSKARRAGVPLPPPKSGRARTRKQAARDVRKGQHRTAKPSARRSRAVLLALKRERHAGTTRLRQSDRNRLLGRARAVFALADMMDFFAHELSRLGAPRFALAGVSTRAVDGRFLWHFPSLQCRHNPDG